MKNVFEEKWGKDKDGKWVLLKSVPIMHLETPHHLRQWGSEKRVPSLGSSILPQNDENTS